jgi:hypothetical protein
MLSVERYESWSERLVREAIERGEFDNLPGAGRPLPGINGREDENWWLKGLLEREHLNMPLPTSLALRKEVSNLPNVLAEIADEADARAVAEDLNERIRESYRRGMDGPRIVVKLVDVEQVLADWARSRRPTAG